MGSLAPQCRVVAIAGLSGLAFFLLTLESSHSAGQNVSAPPERKSAGMSNQSTETADFGRSLRRCAPLWLPYTRYHPDSTADAGAKELAFASEAVGWLSDPQIRRQIGFSREQQETFSRLRRERFRRIQQEILDSTDKWWATLPPEQQAKLHEPGMHARPLSGLAYAFEVGFDESESVPGYPFLAEAAVRDRLGLSAEQEKQLRAIAKAYQEEQEPSTDEKKPAAPVTPGEFYRLQEARPTKEKVEAVLTPRQLTMLKEISFRKDRLWAIDVPHVSQAVGVTEKQKAQLRRLRDEKDDHLRRIDGKAVVQVMKILTPPQREKLRAEIDRRKR
jgi:hypothetical protein